MQLQRKNTGIHNYFLISWVLSLLFNPVFGQSEKSQWVDSVFQTLSMKEKISQLFIVSLPSYTTANDVTGYIKKHAPGGILITRDEPAGMAEQINQLQEASKIPLLVGTDMDWGISPTSDHQPPLNNPLTISSLKDDSLLYLIGSEVGKQMNILGIHINFSLPTDTLAALSYPSARTNNKKRPLAAKSIAFMKGLQDQGIVVFAKEMPLLQDENAITVQDKTAIKDFKESILQQYDQLADHGVDGFLLPCLEIPVWHKKKNITNVFSSPFLALHSLRKNIKFRGLIFTQVCDSNQPGDMFWGKEKTLLMTDGGLLTHPAAIERIIESMIIVVSNKNILKKKMQARVKQILSIKYDLGLTRKPRVDLDNLVDRIKSKNNNTLNLNVAAASVTVAKNEYDQIPVRALQDRTFVSVSVGVGNSQAFDHYLSKFVPFTEYAINTPGDTSLLAKKINSFDVIIISFYSMTPALREAVVLWVNQLSMKQKIILCSFSKLHDLAQLQEMPAVVLGYTDSSPVPMLTAQLIFGAQRAQGKLPVKINPWLDKGQRWVSTSLGRLGYSLPESVGMDANTLERIDSIVYGAIDAGATPGCSVLVARAGKVIFEQAYGWKTYAKQDVVTQETIYDLASITKVAATLQAVMKIYDDKKININKKASVYLPELLHSNKENCIIRDLLTHQAGLWPFLRFWERTIADTTLQSAYYSDTASDEYPFPVAEHMFAHRSMRDSLWQWTIEAPLREKIPHRPYKYKYSDMDFYTMHHLVDTVLRQPMNLFLDSTLYRPLGAYTMGYLPLHRFPASRIAPTEVDMYFRKDTLIGFVHDQGAAMQGGIAGHAGLFSNANDLAKLGQLWLQQGYYGGVQYFDSSTIKKFTAQQYASNRRGLGWDKPAISNWYGSTSLYASPKTFGHTGFTGTAIWVDPEFQLVYVFLSNRIYPETSNRKLLTMNVRTRIQNVIYRSIFNYCKYKSGHKTSAW